MAKPNRSTLEALEARCPGSVETDVPLADVSRWRIGGRADVIVRPKTLGELTSLRKFLFGEGIAHVVLGATSNLLFSDAGVRAVCIQIGEGFDKIELDGLEVTSGPGAWVPGLALFAMQNGLEGLAHTCGIPGTLGGLVCMNGGSQRKGIGEVVKSVTSVDLHGDVHQRPADECGFAYRRSAYQENSEIIAAVTLRLVPAESKSRLRREMIGIMQDRRQKFPQKLPNCGSVFVSDPAMYAEVGPPGRVIERLGLKGLRMGGAVVSPDHANFIVNEGGASAADVLGLIGSIFNTVRTETGYPLKTEVKYVGDDGVISPIDERLFDLEDRGALGAAVDAVGAGHRLRPSVPSPQDTGTWSGGSLPGPARTQGIL